MSETILILAPKGRDAAITEQLLQRRGVAALVCADVHAVHAHLIGDPGGLLVTEEALAGPDLEPLLSQIESQPPWSDFPVIVLASKQAGKRSAVAAATLERLGNVFILERPVNAETLLSGVRSALRGRRRQYQARSYLLERERNEILLQTLNETLEKRAQERAQELAMAREALDFALEAAGMGSWELDPVTSNIRRTAGHDQIFGYPAPLPHWDLDTTLRHVIDDDRASTEIALRDAAANGILELECKIRRPDGEVRWIAVRGRLVHPETGAAARMAGIIMDISERRFAEEALRQSQKMQAIGQLTGGLAHDFNNLLTGITGSLDLLKTRIAQRRTDLDRYIDAAQTSARRAAALTHRLLAFSRQQTLVAKPTDIDRLVDEMEELLRRTMGPAITLDITAADDLWTTFIDPSQLENALLNLCINARDAMPAGGRLTIRTGNRALDLRSAQEHDLEPGEYAMLCVGDTGIGMAADVIRRAFDPFFTTKPIGLGTGLGLSMIYGFVRQSGGQARIQSEPGQGTTVCLYLPRHLGPADDIAEPAAVPTAPRGQDGETVLLIDDEPTVRMLVAEVLHDLGYTTIEATDGPSGVEVLRSDRRIDLLITDVGLPAGMNGRQVADAGRQLRPRLKVLFITGFAEAAVFGTTQLEPGMHILTKPFAMEALATRIREVILETA